MTYLLLLHGWHGFYTLQTLLIIDNRNEQWKSYIGDCLAAITTRIYRWSGAENFEMPFYSELYKPKKDQNLTTVEIRERILDRLVQ